MVGQLKDKISELRKKLVEFHQKSQDSTELKKNLANFATGELKNLQQAPEIREFLCVAASLGDFEFFNATLEEVVEREKSEKEDFWVTNTQNNNAQPFNVEGKDLLQYACEGQDAQIINAVAEKFKEKYNIDKPLENLKKQSYFKDLTFNVIEELDRLSSYAHKLIQAWMGLKDRNNNGQAIIVTDQDFLKKYPGGITKGSFSDEEEASKLRKQIDRACNQVYTRDTSKTSDEKTVYIPSQQAEQSAETKNQTLKPGCVVETFVGGKFKYTVERGTDHDQIYKILIPSKKNDKGEFDYSNSTTLYLDWQGNLIHHHFQGRGSNILDASMAYESGKTIEDLLKEHNKDNFTTQQGSLNAANSSTQDIGTHNPDHRKTNEIAIQTDNQDIEGLKAEIARLKEENHVLNGFNAFLMAEKALKEIKEKLPQKITELDQLEKKKIDENNILSLKEVIGNNYKQALALQKEAKNLSSQISIIQENKQKYAEIFDSITTEDLSKQILEFNEKVDKEFEKRKNEKETYENLKKEDQKKRKETAPITKEELKTIYDSKELDIRINAFKDSELKDSQGNKLAKPERIVEEGFLVAAAKAHNPEALTKLITVAQSHYESHNPEATKSIAVTQTHYNSKENTQSIKEETSLDERTKYSSMLVGLNSRKALNKVDQTQASKSTPEPKKEEINAKFKNEKFEAELDNAMIALIESVPAILEEHTFNISKEFEKYKHINARFESEKKQLTSLEETLNQVNKINAEIETTSKELDTNNTNPNTADKYLKSSLEEKQKRLQSQKTKILSSLKLESAHDSSNKENIAQAELQKLKERVSNLEKSKESHQQTLQTEIDKLVKVENSIKEASNSLIAAGADKDKASTKQGRINTQPIIDLEELLHNIAIQIPGLNTAKARNNKSIKKILPLKLIKDNVSQKDVTAEMGQKLELRKNNTAKAEEVVTRIETEVNENTKSAIKSIQDDGINTKKYEIAIETYLTQYVDDLNLSKEYKKIQEELAKNKINIQTKSALVNKKPKNQKEIIYLKLNEQTLRNSIFNSETRNREIEETIIPNLLAKMRQPEDSTQSNEHIASSFEAGIQAKKEKLENCIVAFTKDQTQTAEEIQNFIHQGADKNKIIEELDKTDQTKIEELLRRARNKDYEISDVPADVLVKQKVKEQITNEQIATLEAKRLAAIPSTPEETEKSATPQHDTLSQMQNLLNQIRTFSNNEENHLKAVSQNPLQQIDSSSNTQEQNTEGNEGQNKASHSFEGEAKAPRAGLQEVLENQPGSKNSQIGTLPLRATSTRLNGQGQSINGQGRSGRY